MHFRSIALPLPDANWSSVALENLPTRATETVTQISAEQQVYSRIRKGYEASFRPLLNPNSSLVVQVKVKLQQLVALNERTQVLTTLVFIEQVGVAKSFVIRVIFTVKVRHARPRPLISEVPGFLKE